MAASAVLVTAAVVLLLAVLGHRNGSGIGVSAAGVGCSLTFERFDSSGGEFTYNKAVSPAFCPANCALSSATTPAAALFGSFPYSPSSSVCLAAIHAGLISNAAGGVVFASRFYRHDWRGGSNQTVYPFDSWRGSLSNGVQSGDVGSDSYRVPAGSREWSYTVRGRGDFVLQRRQAPFSPRAGHVHRATLYEAVADDGAAVLFHVQLVVGGHNGTAYFNDVWVATARLDLSGEDVSWYELQDAPFSPRADVMVASVDAGPVRSSLYFIGGQVGHACGLYELGLCSRDVWLLTVAVEPASGLPSASWSRLASLPAAMEARCGSTTLVWTDVWGTTPRYNVTVVAGQLTYNDSSCSSPPVTVSEQWALEISSTGSIGARRVADAPFSPRRWSSGSNSDDRINGLHQLVGGIRHVSVSRTSTNGTRLTASELTADIWSCFGAPYSCTAFGFNTNPPNGTAVAPLSAPLPTAAAPTSISNSDYYERLFTFGGVIPGAAIEQWRRTRPIVDSEIENVEWSEVAANITMLSAASAATDPTVVMEARMGLPLSDVMDEHELNDPDGNYVRGAGWASSYFVLQSFFGFDVVTLHERPRAYADSPADSSWWTPMAASSAATRRPLHNFDLRRRDHVATYDPSRLLDVGPGSAAPAATWTSGGRSGGQYFNDVILSISPPCLSPTDPSYLAALGPMQLAWPLEPSFWTFAGLWTVGYCPANFHLEPPSSEVFAFLTCEGDSMWMDEDANTVRRCVRDRLSCTWPLVDLGLDYCQPAPPVVQDVYVSYPFNGTTKLSGGGVVIAGVPPNYERTMMLTILGSLFVEPVRVTVHGLECLQAVLTEPKQVLCYNASILDSVDRLQTTYWACSATSQQLTCLLPRLFGVNMDVVVISGLGSELAETNLTRTDSLIVSLTSASPAITRLESAECQGGQESISLSGCPVGRPFNLTVCAASDSIASGSIVQVTLAGSAVSNCSAFSEQRPATGQAAEYCARCSVLPQYGSLLPLVLAQAYGLVSRTAAFVSFNECPAGSLLDRAAVQRGAPDVCTPCSAGSSTMNATGATICTACPAGTYSAMGDADCSPCLPGYYSVSSSSVSCSVCPLNSYANSSRQTGCQLCSLNDYIVYSSNHSRARPVDGECVTCPTGATCTISGQLLAASGQYLTIDQQAATVSAVRCSTTACVSAASADGAQCPLGGSAAAAAADGSSSTGDNDNRELQQLPQLIDASQLRVINCCGRGRWPAYVNTSALLHFNDSQLALSMPDGILDSDGVNVLCAHCLPGYSTVNGRCVHCPSVRWGALSGVLLLAVLLVYAVHRLPHDWTGSATLSIVAYFVQLSAMFKASDLLPQLLALVNMDLLGGQAVGGSQSYDEDGGGALSLAICVVPLDDVGRVRMALLSPVVAWGLLGALAMLQLSARAALIAASRGDGDNDANDSGSSPRCNHSTAWCVYGWLCAPAQPRTQLTAAEEHGAGGGPQSLVEQRSEPLLVDAQPLQQPQQHRAAGRRTAATKSVVRSYQRSLVRLLLLSYSGLSLVALSCLHWQAVGEYGWRLTDYPTVSLGSREWSALLPALVLVLAGVCCAPLALLLFLARQYRSGHIAEAKQRLQLVAADTPEPSTREQLLLQLTAMYRTQHWWMPAYVLVRRLLAAVLLVTVRSVSVWLWLTVAGFLQLALHLHLRPYERAVDNDFESMTLLSLSLQTALLAAYPPPVSASVSAALVGTTTALIAAPLLAIAMHVAVRACRQYRTVLYHQQQQVSQQDGL